MCSKLGETSIFASTTSPLFTTTTTQGRFHLYAKTNNAPAAALLCSRIVAAITSKFDEEFYPTEVLVTPPEGALREPSVVSLNQLQSFSPCGA